MTEEYRLRKKTDTEIEIEIQNEDHTLGNLLAKTIADEEGVIESYYKIEHPLRGGMMLYVRTNGKKDPLDAVKASLEKILRNTSELKKIIEKSLQEQ